MWDLGIERFLGGRERLGESSLKTGRNTDWSGLLGDERKRLGVRLSLDVFLP